MNKAGIVLSASVMITALMSDAYAFDAQRQGFQAGIGIGAHTSVINQDNHASPAFIESEKRVAVDIQIGYGFTNRIVGFLGGKGGSALVNGHAATVTITGAGGTIYWSDSAPSLYLTGIIGQGSLSLRDQDGEFADSGTGWLAGVGYEVSKGLHLELSHARADLVDPQNDANKSAMTATYATIKYVWY